MAFWDGRQWIRDDGSASRPPVRRPRRIRDWIATGVIFAGLVGILLPTSDIQATGPQIQLRPSTAVSGERVRVTGHGFDRAVEVTLVIGSDARPVATVTTNRGGVFSTTFVVPRMSPGEYTMMAMQRSPTSSTSNGSVSALVASAVITVALASPVTAATPPPEPATTPPPTVAATPEPSVVATPEPRPTIAAPDPTAAPKTVPTAAPTPTPAPATPAPAAQPPAAANPPISGFVTRSGTQLMLNGSPYRFSGFNIYNANSRWNCWYQMVGGGLDRALTDIGGGSEVIRAWFFQPLATSNGARDWAAFDATLATARAHNVRVIVTLADHWGACESTGIKGEGWYANGYRSTVYGGERTTYREFVREVVTRYRNDPTVLMWQMMNEAESKTAGGGCSSVEVLRAFASDIGGLIKSIDTNHLVSLGTMGGGQCATAGADYQTLHALPVIDVCEVHDYWDNAAMPGDQWNGLAVRINQCNALGKPLFVGELGRRPQDAGGTIQSRADIFGAKFAAQYAAGIDGILLWGWRNADQGGSAPADYDVGPGDPALAHVRGY